MTQQVKVSCSDCGQSYRVSTEKLGRRIQCRKCGRPFVLAKGSVIPRQINEDTEPATGTWHVAIGKASQGPFTKAHIESLLQAGKATRDTLAWKPGMEDWQSLATISEFSKSTVITATPSIPPSNTHDTPKEFIEPSSPSAFPGEPRTSGKWSLLGGIRDAVADVTHNAQERRKCTICGARMTMYEQAAKMGKCAKCALLDTGLVSDAKEGFMFAQAATYKGGLIDYVEQGKRNGFAYIYARNLYFFDDKIRWSLPFQQIIRTELESFQIGGARAVLAGINAVALQQVRNTLAVTFLDGGVEHTARFQIHGAATIPGEGVKAQEFLNHLLRFKSQFSSAEGDVIASSGHDIESRLEKLEQMKNKGLIREDEYQRKRDELIELL